MGDVRMSAEDLAKANPLVGVTVSAEALASAIQAAVADSLQGVEDAA